jgi:membrane protein YqaA with SNARE-associated domain
MAEAAPPADDALLARGHLDRAVRRALVGLALFVVALNVAGFFFEVHIVAAADWLFARVGLAGLVGAVIFADIIPSPIPPDALLLLLSRSEHAAHGLLVTVAIGLLSVGAGGIGYGVGRLLGARPLGRAALDAIPAPARALVRRYGPWGVAIGALTPIPFSLTCWTAGLFRIGLGRTLLMCLFRIPRFLVSYALICLAL